MAEECRCDVVATVDFIIPDGIYRVKIHSIGIDNESGDVPLMHWEYLVVAGENAGTYIRKKMPFTNENAPLIEDELANMSGAFIKAGGGNFEDGLRDVEIEVTKRTIGNLPSVMINL